MKGPKALFDAVEFLLQASKNGRGPAHQAQADAHLSAIAELKAEVLKEAEGAAHAVAGAAEELGKAVVETAVSGLGAFSRAEE